MKIKTLAYDFAFIEWEKNRTNKTKHKIREFPVNEKIDAAKYTRIHAAVGFSRLGPRAHTTKASERTTINYLHSVSVNTLKMHTYQVNF